MPCTAWKCNPIPLCCAGLSAQGAKRQKPRTMPGSRLKLHHATDHRVVTHHLPRHPTLAQTAPLQPVGAGKPRKIWPLAMPQPRRLRIACLVRHVPGALDCHHIETMTQPSNPALYTSALIAAPPRVWWQGGCDNYAVGDDCILMMVAKATASRP